jgi:hypothetical protein
MIADVARAVEVAWATWKHDNRRQHVSWDDVPDQLLARAAIEALRKPPERVLAAFNSYAMCAGYISEGWEAAIDELLK